MTERLRIGLTGGIASGKSTAALRFSALGIPVIDADEAARAVVAPATSGLEQVIQRFGPSMVTANGELDRRALRDLIFSDPAARADLNGILHPLIRSHMDQQATNVPGPYVILAIPLLVENGRQRDRVDRVLVVDVDEHVQLQRLTARDGSTEQQARAILAAQASRCARLSGADDIVDNAGSVTELQQAVDRLHRRYLELAHQKQSLP